MHTSAVNGIGTCGGMAETKKEQKAMACGAHCSGAGSSRMLSWHKTYHVPDFFLTQGRMSKALLSFWPHKQQAVMTPVSTRTFRALSRTMYVQSCTLIPADDAASHGPIHHSGCCRQRSCPQKTSTTSPRLHSKPPPCTDMHSTVKTLTALQDKVSHIISCSCAGWGGAGAGAAG